MEWRRHSSSSVSYVRLTWEVLSHDGLQALLIRKTCLGLSWQTIHIWDANYSVITGVTLHILQIHTLTFILPPQKAADLGLDLALIWHRSGTDLAQVWH